MSIKRLTDAEKATYLVGLAVRRHFDRAPQNAETEAEFKTISRWIKRLADKYALHISDNASWRWTEYELALIGFRSVVVGTGKTDQPPEPSRPARRPKLDKPDDIPF